MNIDGHTKMYCLIGSPVGHSGSPAMYNYSFDRLGINAAYLAYDVPLEKTGEAVAALKLLGCGGFDITMPCKTEVTKYLDRLSPACELIGASNCVIVEEDGTLTGHNTDGLGFVANLRVHGVDVKGKKMVILGAGGAGTAVTMQSAVDGASEIHIFNRKGYTFYPNAELTVKKITEKIPGCKASVTDLADTEALVEAVKNCDILVNATKVGMAPLDKETLIDKSLFRSDLVVADTVYNPKETRMILEAKEAGVRAAIGGIGMLLRQGVEGFRLYTGKEMPADEVMDKFFA
ncbi:MAG TPA: shikimate dehydrogenase [Candidatus Scatomorpha pullistercoris]|uniref:Shikimate dehydrogenase (NADP(+)) n=1 Tax=Candidatus Scatomorpha pullistercoris TaxID=2840929 RepID=A0A9D1G4M5_9FIRM|nr:shikimate dehydrogenase [Candidatus Scatomorpha pullistercoris]